MTLDPDRYECPDHQVDLTGLVEEALLDEGPPVAYRRLWPGRKASGERPFQVIITCPGADGTAPHPLTCTGTQAP
jgi:hypothetical protein